MPKITILIPTFNRVTSLAVTLTTLISQTYRDFEVVVSDQATALNIKDDPSIKALSRVIKSHGNNLTILKNLPNQGIAQQRQFLIDHSISSYSLFLDDDLILEPWVLENLVKAIEKEQCGFVGQSVIGLSFIHDIRPTEQIIEFWDEKVRPEKVSPHSQQWQRYMLHNAANLYHVQNKLKIKPYKPKCYKIAWLGGCVLYDTQKLRSIGSFAFWPNVPKHHCGEDVLVQLRVMAKYGGCGLIPSGVYHQELPTTIPDRQINLPEIIKVFD